LVNQVVGVFWGQNYHDAENVRFSKKGTQLEFTMDGAKATFVRIGSLDCNHRSTDFRDNNQSSTLTAIRQFCVLAPSPLFTITIESGPHGSDRVTFMPGDRASWLGE
jgi:hypothetical protein